MWRYRELLPVADDEFVTSLGEVETPIVAAPRLAAELGLARLWIKDEARLPTLSFKARGMAVAVSMARSFGIEKAALASAGNAGGAAAAYCARARIELHVFMPSDTPSANQIECRLHGASVHLFDGLISDCGRIVSERQSSDGWLNLGTLNQPFRIEGKKTMGLELADQFAVAIGSAERCLPDAIIYPTGGGTGLIGMWKAFSELRGLGGPLTASTVGGNIQPRLYSVQAEGCAPIVKAFEAGERFAAPIANAVTAASGLRVPSSIGDFLMLDAIRESGGIAISGEESQIRYWMRRAASADGISLCPESAIALDGLRRLVSLRHIKPSDAVLLFNTASALKYQELL
jgi:threonine synthase